MDPSAVKSSSKRFRRRERERERSETFPLIIPNALGQERHLKHKSKVLYLISGLTPAVGSYLYDDS